jgi:sigma-B regulation protein RsbU (phosphoserine phosphatase)
MLNPTGPALGILSEATFKTKKLDFHPGDIFLFYTDGLVEASDGHEEFGELRLQQFLHLNQHKSGQQILLQLFQTVKKFSTNERDDLTALLIKVDK